MNPQKDVKLQMLTASTVLPRSNPLEVLLLLLIVSTIEGGILQAQKLLLEPGFFLLLVNKCLQDLIKNEQGTIQSVFFYYYYFQ